VRHVLHPPVGARCRAAAARRLVGNARATLWRSARDPATTRAAPAGFPFHRGARHGGRLHREQGCGGGMNILPLDGATRSWDGFVSRAEGSSFCHLAGWRDIMSDVLGAECLYRVATNGGGEWEGVLPLVRVKSRIFGHYLVSLPFLNYGGPLGSQAAQDRLVQEAVTEAARTRADLLELRTRDPGGFDLPVSSRKITVLLPLPSDPETLFTRFPAKLRSQIRRPMKEGLEVRFGPEQREPFYEVFARTMRDLGTPVLPRALFERIAA